MNHANEINELLYRRATAAKPKPAIPTIKFPNVPIAAINESQRPEYKSTAKQDDDQDGAFYSETSDINGQ